MRTSKLSLVSLVALTILAGSLAACGSDDEDDKSADDETDGTGTVAGGGGGKAGGSTVVQDGVAQSAFSAVDDATDALTDDAATGLSLAELDITRTKTCAVADDGTLTVTIALSGSAAQTLDLPKRSIAVALAASGTETRKWTPPANQTLECSAADGHAKIRWKQDVVVADLTLDVTVDKGMTKSREVTLKKDASKTTSVDNWSAKGARRVTFAAVTEADATLVELRKTLTSSVTRTKKYTAKDGSEGSLNETISTKAGVPFVVDVARSATDGSLQKKTVASGILVSTDNVAGARVETQFANVVYDLSATNTNKCLPTQGQISGGSFAKDATTATSTFVITFGATTDSGVSIAFDGAAAVDYPDYNPKGCDLEREI